MGRSVEGGSYAEAWCCNCGWRCSEPNLNDAMDAAQEHAEACEHDQPSVMGQHVTLFTVDYPQVTEGSR